MTLGTSERPDLPLALVVGAGAMGMAVARRLGERHRLLLTDVDRNRLESRVAALREEGHDVQSFACDITDGEAVDRLAETASALGPLRVLAHVAGLSPSTPDGHLIMRVNLLGASHVERAMRPLATRGTAAIFIASNAAYLMPPPSADILRVFDGALDGDFLDRLEKVAGPIDPMMAYHLSKTALVRMCRRQAPAWGQSGARIVSLCPGFIATPMGAESFEQNPIKHEMYKKTPLAREGTMLEIGDAVEFLASERASFITGADLLVDGGVSAAMEFS